MKHDFTAFCWSYAHIFSIRRRYVLYEHAFTSGGLQLVVMLACYSAKVWTVRCVIKFRETMYFFLYLFSFLIYARILRLRRIGSTKEDSNSQFTVPQFICPFIPVLNILNLIQSFL